MNRFVIFSGNRLKKSIRKLPHLSCSGCFTTPPGQYIPIVCQLTGQGLNREKEPDGFTRMIIEKPFGHDLKSAQALNRNLNIKGFLLYKPTPVFP
ncbi:MAG TPA: hypothetical protein ENF21_07130 [Bacteroidetes bacterium]|nr:hypothetical protein [Bacteroidota bacterium]